MLTVRSTINIAGQAVPNIIPAVQGDTGRSIEFTLADFTIPAGATANYYIQKPSGEAVYNAAEIVDNTVIVNLTAQALAEPYDNYGQVRIFSGDEVVTSFDFILLVKPFRGIDAIESTTEMNIFDKAVQNAMANIDGMLPNIIAPVFDTSTTYTAGDYVIYSGKLYQFTSAHTGAWTGTDAEETIVTEKLGGGSGDGLTEDIKQALLQIARKVAYVDDQGQDYYDALYDALYPPTDLVRISAVYTQSGTVYDTASLDSLKADLVVTAHYSDSSTQTVTTYTLSGTLEEGTSTITVTYSGKTTTFTVTVTAVPKYQLANGTHNFTKTNYNGYVTISNHSHVKFDRTNAPSSEGGANFLCLSDLDYNGTDVGQSSNINNHSKLFSLSSGDVVRFVVSNVSGSFDDFTIGLRRALNVNSVAAVANQTTDLDQTINISSAADVGCLFLYVGTQDAPDKDIEADIEVYVNDVRYF